MHALGLNLDSANLWTTGLAGRGKSMLLPVLEQEKRCRLRFKQLGFGFRHSASHPRNTLVQPASIAGSLNLHNLGIQEIVSSCPRHYVTTTSRHCRIACLFLLCTQFCLLAGIFLGEQYGPLHSCALLCSERLRIARRLGRSCKHCLCGSLLLLALLQQQSCFLVQGHNVTILCI